MKEIKIDDFSENPFKLIGSDWMLITAKKDDIFTSDKAVELSQNLIEKLYTKLKDDLYQIIKNDINEIFASVKR